MRRLLICGLLWLGGCANALECGSRPVPAETVAQWQFFAALPPGDSRLIDGMERLFDRDRNPEVAYNIAYAYAIEGRAGPLRRVEEQVLRSDDLLRFAARCGVKEAAHWLSLRYRDGRRGRMDGGKAASCLGSAAKLPDKPAVAAKVAECGVPFTGFRNYWNRAFFVDE